MQTETLKRPAAETSDVKALKSAMGMTEVQRRWTPRSPNSPLRTEGKVHVSVSQKPRALQQS